MSFDAFGVASVDIINQHGNINSVIDCSLDLFCLREFAFIYFTGSLFCRHYLNYRCFDMKLQ